MKTLRHREVAPCPEVTWPVSRGQDVNYAGIWVSAVHWCPVLLKAEERGAAGRGVSALSLVTERRQVDLTAVLLLPP